jgi:hypothetical protein
VPWSRLRQYTIEEAADDSSSRTLKAMGLSPDGNATLLVTTMPTLSSVCLPLVDANQPVPYGENLRDEHHATCWRLMHQRQFGATLPASRLVPMRRLGPEPTHRSLIRDDSLP